MIDMKPTVIPKSDQLNSDDFIGGATRTIKITGVRVVSKDQPVSISFDGDKGKPYKPCVSMTRVMIMVWGDDGEKYIGQSMTLFSDPSVTWAGKAVGGIRISHMTGLREKRVMQLTATKGNKKPYTVDPLILNQDVAKNATTEPEKTEPITAQQVELLQEKLKSAGMKEADFCEKMKIADIKDLDKTRLDSAHTRLDAKIKEEAF